MASDGDGVFATTGNANGIPATNQDSEAVVRITGMATLDRTTNANIFFPAGIATGMTPVAVGLGLAAFLAKLVVLAGAVVLVETTNAKLRLFRVPDLLSAAFVLATLALMSTYLFQ